MTPKEFEIHCKLNELYKPVIDKSNLIKKEFEDKGYSVTAMFANNHYIEYKGKFLLEHYPLRVLDVENVGDFVFDFESTSFEKYYDIKTLLKFNLEKIIETFKNSQLDFYGESDCCMSIYKEKMNVNQLKENIKNKDNERIAINFKINNFKNDIKFILENMIAK